MFIQVIVVEYDSTVRHSTVRQSTVRAVVKMLRS